MSEEEIIETKKNIEFWEIEVQKHLKNNDIMQAVGCRLLANNLRESIGEKNMSEDEIIEKIKQIKLDFKYYNPIDKKELEAIQRFIRLIQ